MKYRTLSPAIAIAALSLVSQPAAAHAPELHQPNQQNQTSSSPSPSPSQPSPSPENTCTPTQGQPSCSSDRKPQDDPQNDSQEPSPQPSTESQSTSNQQIAKSPTAGWGEAIFGAIVGLPGLLYWLKYRIFS